MEKFDVTVIGAGPGGYPAAIRAAQLGARVAIVEKELAGGTCLNWGCIPTKSLIACSDLFAHIGKASTFGISAQQVTADYAAMVTRKDGIVSKLRSGIEALLKAHAVTVIKGTAAFAGRNRLEVTTPDGTVTTIETAATIIASGSESAMPGFLPKSPRVIESRAFLSLTQLPKSLLVLGGGVLGCEFACMAAQLGVKVTIVELLEDILMMLDPDVRKELRHHMERTLGIRVLTGKALQNVEADNNAVRGTFGEETLSADLLLVSVGRRPVTRELNLAAAGLTVDKTGCIPVNAYGATSAATIYAIGDVNGVAQLAHAATSQGVIAAENIVTKRSRKFDKLVPACIFTSPEIGSAGLTEQQAMAGKIPVKTGKFAFTYLGKALAAGEPYGFVKWVADEKTGQLLGAQAIGLHATELISEAVTAIRMELTASELGRTIHCHPTLSETWMEAAHVLEGHCVHAPPARMPRK
jgi:dihydrolipoamide dehydrogenase